MARFFVLNSFFTYYSHNFATIESPTAKANTATISEKVMSTSLARVLANNVASLSTFLLVPPSTGNLPSLSLRVKKRADALLVH